MTGESEFADAASSGEGRGEPLAPSDEAAPPGGRTGAGSGSPADVDTDAASGLPDETTDQPLGVPEAEPEGEGDPARGPEAMPGIPTEGEPPSAG